MARVPAEHIRDQGARSGWRPDVAAGDSEHAARMPRFLIHHRHEPCECGVVFAAFRGHESPLRHRATLASCAFGGHAIWWCVDAAGEAEALGLLPYYVAQRANATQVTKVEIP
jgi:hypothetical protein